MTSPVVERKDIVLLTEDIVRKLQELTKLEASGDAYNEVAQDFKSIRFPEVPVFNSLLLAKKIPGNYSLIRATIVQGLGVGEKASEEFIASTEDVAKELAKKEGPPAPDPRRGSNPFAAFALRAEATPTPTHE